MKYRKLGASDLTVSEISLGSWLTYGDRVGQDQAKACIDKAFDLGVNFFDTANVYGGGAAETCLGAILSDRPRDSYVLATKVFFPMSATDRGLSRAQIAKQVDASLRRLRVDHLDLYQCHRYDSETPLEETMQALSDVVRQGKARYVGFSEWSPQQIEQAFAIPDVEAFVSSQPQYSLLWRQPEAAVIPLCAAKGVSQIVWSPLAQGVLSGKYRPGAQPPKGSRGERIRGAMQAWLQPEVLNTVQKLKPLADKAGCSLSQLALAWVLSNPNVASAIVGASSPQQLEENAAANDLVVDSALFREAEAIAREAQQAE